MEIVVGLICSWHRSELSCGSSSRGEGGIKHIENPLTDRPLCQILPGVRASHAAGAFGHSEQEE